jgi:DNA-binding IclR family transcriptional regulator
VAAYLSRHGLERLTDRTITDPAKLHKELASIRRRGYATSLGERQPGAASVAAPVFDHDGHVVAVISVAGPAARFRPESTDAVPALLAAAARVSGQLGYDPPAPVKVRGSRKA